MGTQIEEQMMAVNYNSEFKMATGTKSGISGKVLKHALFKKQQEQLLTENFFRFQENLYSQSEMQTNLLLKFYPQQVQEHITKRKHHHTEKVFRGVQAP